MENLPATGITTPEQINALATGTEADLPAPVDAGAPVDNSAANSSIEVEKRFRGEIAAYANEIWIRSTTTGRWHIQSGELKRKMLEWYRSNPNTNGRWGALMIHCAADPNNTGEWVYYSRNSVAKPWAPLDVKTHCIACHGGVYDLQAREWEPYPPGMVVFGPLIDTDINAGILEQCRAGDYTHAPAKFRELMDMVAYALENDPATVRYFQQIVAQVLRPHAGWNAFCHVYGESGARKTTILRALLSAPCGVRGYNEISEELLAERHFTRIGLVNRIANLSNDSATTKRFGAFVKEVTSGMIQVEKKFHDNCKLPLTAKLFATMNVPQDYSDISLGIENRLIAFKFRVREDNDRGAEGMRWMQPAFFSDEDRRWIVHWMVAGLESLYNNGREAPPEPSPLARQWKEDLLNEANRVRGFVCEHLIHSPGTSTPTDTVIDRAVEVRAANPDHRHAFAVELGKFLRQRWGVTSKQVRVDGERVYMLKDVALKELD